MRRLAVLALALPAAACGVPDDRLPSTRDQRVAAVEDQPVEFRLEATDADGDELTWSATRPAHGTLVVDGPSATYTPVPDFNGTDLVQVTVSDGERSARSFVLFEVGPVEDAPRLVPDTFPAVEDEPLVLPVSALLANDVEPDGEPLRVTGATAIAGGEVLLVDDVLVFVPKEDYVGAARFAYRATDGHHVETADVILRVGGTNDPPIGVADVLVTTEDEPVTVPVATLLRNDVDPDGDTLVLTRVLEPVGGDVRLDRGEVRFTPTPDFIGEAGFAYALTDGRIEHRVEVTVVIYPADDAPTTTPLVVTGTEDEVVTIPVETLRAAAHDGDGDPLTVLAVDLPVHGSVGLVGDEVRFWPEPDATGTAGFRYFISDGRTNATGEVTIVLAAVDDAPVADAQVRSTPVGAPITITLTGHDVDSADLTFDVIEGPTSGTYLPRGGNEVEYKPAPGFTGSDSFVFVARAGGVTSAPARVTILVLGDVCGDGAVDAGEACDDGNHVDGDGCDSACSITACGNGITASPAVASATLRWLGATCNGADLPLVLTADGVVIVEVPGGDGECTCDEPIRSVTLDADAVAALTGAVDLELTFAGLDSHLAWAELVVSSGSGSSTIASRALPLYSAASRERGAPWPEQLCATPNQSEVAAFTPFVFTEECDDGNLVDGDGCSAACTIE